MFTVLHLCEQLALTGTVSQQNFEAAPLEGNTLAKTQEQSRNSKPGPPRVTLTECQEDVCS